MTFCSHAMSSKLQAFGCFDRNIIIKLRFPIICSKSRGKLENIITLFSFVRSHYFSTQNSPFLLTHSKSLVSIMVTRLCMLRPKPLLWTHFHSHPPATTGLSCQDEMDQDASPWGSRLHLLSQYSLIPHFLHPHIISWRSSFLTIPPSAWNSPLLISITVVTITCLHVIFI